MVSKGFASRVAGQTISRYHRFHDEYDKLVSTVGRFNRKTAASVLGLKGREIQSKVRRSWSYLFRCVLLSGAMIGNNIGSVGVLPFLAGGDSFLIHRKTVANRKPRP